MDPQQITREGEAAIGAAASTDALAQVETEWLGKRSVLAQAHRSVGALDPAARKEAGRQLQEVRATLEARLATRRAGLQPGERPPPWWRIGSDRPEVIPAGSRRRCPGVTSTW